MDIDNRIEVYKKDDSVKVVSEHQISLRADSTQLFVDCVYEEVDLSDVDWSLMKYGMSMFQCCGVEKIKLGCPKLDSLYSMSVFMEEMGVKERLMMEKLK